MKFVNFLYNFLLILADGLFKPLIALFLPKFKQRQSELDNSLTNLDKIKSKPGRRVWFHASSMGEFEQAKPIIEYLKKIDESIIIICSFFSPSGYNTQKNYSYADAIVYMPLDTKKNAKKFIDLINPNVAIFVRYEIWRNHLLYLKEINVPTMLIDATAPSKNTINDSFFMDEFYQKTYTLFDSIFTVSEQHSKYFDDLKISSEVITLTDTRFDRIAAKVEEAKLSPVLSKEIFDENEFVLIAGSSWEADENLIIDAVKKIGTNSEYKVRVIYTPHEPTNEHIHNLTQKIDNLVKLSDILKKQDANQDLSLFKNKDIVVDSIGKLLRLYANANAAFIGGAFGVGVHSLTEPAGYGIPLACGPNCFNSPDAKSLIDARALKSVKDSEQFYDYLLALLNDKKMREEFGLNAKNYVHSRLGSSRIIAETILGSL